MPWAERAADVVGVDRRSLAVVRAGLGALVLCDIAGRLPDLTAFLTDGGVLPRWAAGVWLPVEAHLSVYMLSGAAWFAAAMLGVAALAAGALVAGWHTRLATIVSWYLLFAVQARNPAVDYGGDNLLRMLLFWGMFLPLGSRWSLDRAAGRVSAPGSPRVVSAATIAVQLQVCLVYWTTAAFKWASPQWFADGSAIGVAMRLDYLSTSWGRFLLRFPRALALLTRGALGLETLGPLAVWSPVATGPLRALVVLAFVLFHLVGIGPTLRLGLFSWISALAWCLFLPDWLWVRLASGRLGPVMARLDRSDARGDEPAAGAAGAAAVKVSAAPAGVEHAAPVAQEGAPTASGLRGGSARGETGPRGGRAAPAWRRLAGLVVACLFVFVVLLNLRELDAQHFARLLPAASAGVEQALALHQRWDMFAPAPPTDDGWYVVVGRLAGDGAVDPWREAPIDAGRPARFADVYGGARWTKYLTNLHHPAFVHHRRLFSNYLCRRWNATHRGAERLDRLSIVYMLERTVPPDRELPAQPLLLFAQPCPAEAAE